MEFLIPSSTNETWFLMNSSQLDLVYKDAHLNIVMHISADGFTLFHTIHIELVYMIKITCCTIKG